MPGRNRSGLDRKSTAAANENYEVVLEFLIGLQFAGRMLVLLSDFPTNVVNHDEYPIQSPWVGTVDSVVLALCVGW